VRIGFSWLEVLSSDGILSFMVYITLLSVSTVQVVMRGRFMITEQNGIVLTLQANLGII
jgi:hypothetical protein